MNYENHFISEKYGEIWYHSDIDSNEYLYVVCAKWKQQKVEILINNFGVSLDYIKTQKLVHTNINPESLFGQRVSLEPNHLEKIVDLVIASGGDGKVYTKQARKKMHKEWKYDENAE